MNLASKFIVIDGPDGAGKGTLLARLERWIVDRGGACTHGKDPGGTKIGERIRRVLLGYDLSAMSPRCEALLFMASRAQLVAEVVKPALDRGDTVLCDRFISATYAYQVAAGFPRDELLQLGRLAVGEHWPHLTIILDLPPEVGFQRTGRKPHHARKRDGAPADQMTMFEDHGPDAMERRPLEFHRRVRELFLELPGVYPTPVVVIDAHREPDAVFAAVQEALRDAFG